MPLPLRFFLPVNSSADGDSDAAGRHPEIASWMPPPVDTAK